jgi:hypothetical protein
VFVPIHFPFGREIPASLRKQQVRKAEPRSSILAASKRHANGPKVLEGMWLKGLGQAMLFNGKA